MKLYRIIPNCSIPTFFGFHAQTFGPLILIPGMMVTKRVLTHELRHVEHFYAAWVWAFAFWVVLNPGPFWLLATPFAYALVYTLAGCYAVLRGGHWYRDNPFEKDARRHAGEV